MPAIYRQRICLFMALITWGCSLPFTASAQQTYGRVIEATPIYEQVATPHESCTEFSSYRRCTNTTTYEDVVAGYDVLYEYNGQRYTQRMAYNPGKRIPIQTTPKSGSYSSNNASNSSVVIPGQQSWSTTIPGAPTVDSIQYQSNDDDVPVNIDWHLGKHPRR